MSWRILAVGLNSGATATMLTKLISVPRLAREARTNVPTVRALIDTGLVDGFVTETGHRAGDARTVTQIRQHLAEQKKR